MYSGVSPCFPCHELCLWCLPQIFTVVSSWISFNPEKKNPKQTHNFRRRKGLNSQGAVSFHSTRELTKNSSFWSPSVGLICPHQCRQESSDTPPAPRTLEQYQGDAHIGDSISSWVPISLPPVAQHGSEVGKHQSPLHRTTEKQKLSLGLLTEFSHLGGETSVLKSKIPIWVTPQVSSFPFGEGSAQALPLGTSELCLLNAKSPSSYINPTWNQKSQSPGWDSSFWGPFSRDIWALMHTSRIRPFTKYSHFFWRSSWSMGCNHNPPSLSGGQGVSRKWELRLETFLNLKWCKPRAPTKKSPWHQPEN